MISGTVLKLLLRPIVRFFVRNAKSFQEFQNCSKSLFVEESEALLREFGERTSVSRISAMTGLNRRDIAHIQKHAGAPWYEGASVLARVLAHWENSTRFATAHRGARALSWKGDDSEFAHLVREITLDLHHGTALFELRRAGLVEVQDDYVRLTSREAIIPGDLERGFSVLSRDLGTLIKVAQQNICTPESIKHLHLRTEFDNIEQAMIPAIKQWLIDQGREFHRKAREFFSQLDLDLSSAPSESAGGGRVVLSTFGLAEIGKSPTGEIAVPRAQGE